MTANHDEALLRERFRAIGLDAYRIERREGLFAATLYDVWTAAAGSDSQRYIYKLPPPERNGEFDVVGKLGAELAPWLPEGIVRFESSPKAIAMRYAGEPILPPDRAGTVPAAERLEAYELVSERLAELHLRTAAAAERWASEGKAAPYAYSREWADALLMQAESVLDRGEWAALSRIASDFYARYSASVMRGPVVFTHGDPHWGNALRLGDRVTLIDWEWTNVAAPMRDIAILVQEEPDDEMLSGVAASHATRLLANGLPGEYDDVMADFDLMMVDNSIMTLAWDVALFRRGDIGPERLREASERRLARIETFWNRTRR
ncbi:phosphotransferase [Paenibacillus sp.]|uniref:phosphotransferase n=1 Tax=Paenibacillus sp. TaxID=58172 RepID=UPI002810B6E3|nr:hypothetical protein [Paenibacillus sp.]